MSLPTKRRAAELRRQDRIMFEGEPRRIKDICLARSQSDEGFQSTGRVVFSLFDAPHSWTVHAVDPSQEFDLAYG